MAIFKQDELKGEKTLSKESDHFTKTLNSYQILQIKLCILTPCGTAACTFYNIFPRFWMWLLELIQAVGISSAAQLNENN